MDKLIQDIINFDHECAASVEDAKHQRALSSTNMNARKKEVYDQFVNEYQKTLDEKKKELKASIEATKKENDEHYMQQLSSLSSYFEAHKDEWIAKMVAACNE